MLVLSRKLDETVLIGSTIRVRVLAIRGKHVRLGIEAPADVNILREELGIPADSGAERASAVTVHTVGAREG